MRSSTAWLSSEPWLPAARNAGHIYRDRVRPADLSTLAGGLPATVAGFYAARYAHSELGIWLERLAAGEICRNGQQLRADGSLAAKDELLWHRPPWQEPAVPALPGPLFDDGDLLAFNKPSGLPVLPAGGFLVHTVLGQIEAAVVRGELEASAGRPRPVHRLGRFTSGLLLCARQPQTRAWLSALLRESTAHKIYRALTAPLARPAAAGGLELAVGDSLELATPIGRRFHPRLGSIWCAAAPGDPGALAASSRLTVLEHRAGCSLVEVAIRSGRPHQIRIHCAVAGAPLLGDPLYLPGGLARPDALPGDGGYRLHAHRLRLPRPQGELLALEAPLPPELQLEARSKAISREK